MKKYLKFKKFVFFLMVCTLLVSILPAKGQAASSSKYFNVNAYMRSPIHVKLGWKKKDVSKYVIYRADAKADGSVGAYKRIADVSGKKTFYLDKIADGDLDKIWEENINIEGKYYSYKVYGYKKIEGKYRKVCHGQRMVYTGAWETMWDEYQHCDAKITPESIPLTVWSGYEFEPDYYRIYRSEDGKNFKVLTEIRSSEYGVTYTDADVETGKAYYYKARTYRLAGKEKVFSNYTNTLKLSAVNQNGVYDLEVLTPANEETSQLVMKLTSDPANGELIFTGGIGFSCLYYYTQYDYEGEEMDVSLDITGYSYDNQTWEDFGEVKGENLVVKADETIYLRFETRDGSTFKYMGPNDEDTTMGYEEVTYNNLTSIMDFEQEGGRVVVRMNGEYYHQKFFC